MPAQGRGANLKPSQVKAAPKLPPPKASPLKGITGATKTSPKPPIPRGVKGGVRAGSKPATPFRPLGLQEEGRHIMEAERKRALPKPRGPGLLELAALPLKGAERAVAHPGQFAKYMIHQPVKDIKGEGALQQTAGIGGLLLHKGAADILGTKGASGVAGQKAADIASEFINLPTQIPPTLYQVSKASLAYKQGDPKPLKEIERGLAEGSAGKLVRGKPKAAAEQAWHTPVQSTLEYSGAAALGDRLAAIPGRIKGHFDETPREAAAGPSRPPKKLLGKLTEPQRPYGKGYIQKLRQKAQDNNPKRPGERTFETLRGKNLSTRIKRLVDQREGRFHGTQRQVRAIAERRRSDTIRGPRTIHGEVIPGIDAVNLFAHGFLPDPSVMGKLGPEYQHQIQALAEHYSGPNPGETTPDPERLKALEDVERSAQDTAFHRNPHAAHNAAIQIAKDKAEYEASLEKLYGYTPQQVRGAKYSTPFQWWWRNQDPWIEHAPPLNEAGIAHRSNMQLAHDLNQARQTSLEELREAKSLHGNAKISTAELKAAEDAHRANVGAYRDALAKRKASAPKVHGEHHESPYSISNGRGGRKHLTLDEIAKELEKKGVYEHQLSFMSHRPGRTAASDLFPPPGVSRGGAPPSRGFRSGKAALMGHLDLTHDALARQYMSDLLRIDREHQNTIINREFGLTKKDAADLLEEGLAKQPPEYHAAIRARIDALRSGTTFFKPHVRVVKTPNGTETHIRATGYDQARAEADRVFKLTGVRLTPYRVASPFAPGARLEQIAHEAGDAQMHDQLSPDIWEEGRGLDKFEKPHAQDRGEWGLMHKAAADRFGSYEKMMNSNTRTVLSNMSAAWRKYNVAWSQKHIPGVAQELGIRQLAYGVGPLSLMRGFNALKELRKAAEDPAFRAANPEVDHYLREIEHQVGGTVVQQAFDQTLHLPKERIENTALGKLAKAFQNWESHKVTGFPARMMADLGRGYSKVTNKILKIEKALIEKPAKVAGLGKVLNNEAKALAGKRIPVLKQMDSLMQEFIKGQFNPKSVDQTAHMLNEMYGDFQAASPATRNAQVVSPFWTWYRQALKFIYHTLPVHHPIKTGILAALEGATLAQREAEGQGYQRGLKLKPGELQASQQGSIPSIRKNGKRWELIYYMPSGAVSKGVEGLKEMFFPYLDEPLQNLAGKDIYGNELPGSPEGVERVILALGSLGESMFPAARKIKLVSEGEPEKAFLPVRENKPRNPKGEVIEEEAPSAPEPNVYEGSGAVQEGQVYEK